MGHPSGASVTCDGAADLVAAVGTSDFGKALMSIGTEVVGADYCSLFLFRGLSSPICLAAAGKTSSGLAQQASKKYVAGHWRLDPSLSGASEADYMIHHIYANELHDQRYSYDCYDVLNIGDRVTVLFSEASIRLRLSFYRLRNHLPFGEAEKGTLVGSFRLFREAARRHYSLSSENGIDPATGLPSMGAMADRLANLNCGLSEREVQVCCRIVTGMTTEAISLDLEIGAASVVTYRKRAYAKLGISSQNELFARCLRP